MEFIRRKKMSYTSLFYAILCVWLCGSDGVESGFKIYRSKLDIFTNLKCMNDVCTKSNCTLYGAECVSKDNCNYCRCFDGRNTFITSGVDQGECKRDEYIEPKSVPNKKFRLTNYKHKKCLKVEGSRLIIGANCKLETLDMFWIWTKKTHLMNVKTLKCVGSQTRYRWNAWVNMSICQSSNADMTCMRNTENSRKMIGWKIWWQLWQGKWRKRTYNRWRSLNLLQISGQYHVIAIARKRESWSSSNAQRLCESKTSYTGCYRFSDGSFMKYLNQSEINSNVVISAPIFNENGNSCKVKGTMELRRDGQDWETTTRLFSVIITNHNSEGTLLKKLELNSTELFRAFNGTLLKLFVTCGTEEHCVLFKLESIPNYTEESHADNSTSTKEAVPSTSPSIPSNSRKPTAAERDQSKKRSESGETNATVIAVTVTLVLVALALATGFLFFYRRRKRAQVPAPNNNDLGAVNYSEEIYEDPDRVYETLKEDGNSVSPNQPEASSDIYSYPDGNIVANPFSNEQEYTYPKETDFPKSSATTRPKAKGQTGGAVYETLEPNDDGFYNYPENTNIKPLISAQNEQEYSYAKNTAIPSVPLGTPQNNDHSSPPDGSGLYHTLEEPNPSQLPVYATLEESADVDDSK